MCPSPLRLPFDHRVAASTPSAEVYRSYIAAAGGKAFFLTIILCYVIGEASRIGSSFWLGAWAADSFDGQSTGFYMGIYFALSLMQSVMSLGVSYVGAHGSVRAAKELHAACVVSILRSPMSFFDSTPLGRILNRFTKDMSQMDTQLMFNVQLFLNGTIRLCVVLWCVSGGFVVLFTPMFCVCLFLRPDSIGTLITIAIVSPYAIVSFVPTMLTFCTYCSSHRGWPSPSRPTYHCMLCLQTLCKSCSGRRRGN